MTDPNPPFTEAELNADVELTEDGKYVRADGTPATDREAAAYIWGNREPEPARMAWSGLCGDCLSGFIVYPTDDQTEGVQQQVSSTWPKTFADCPVEDCDGTIDWNGNDPIAQVLAPRML